MHPCSAILPALLVCPAVFAAAELPAQDSHQKIAEDLVELLSQTEVALNTCQDADSVSAALPTFRKLAAVADSIAARQTAISAPTIQDDIAVSKHAEDFAKLWQAIRRHIDRLEKGGLLSDDLRAILHIAPVAR